MRDVLGRPIVRKGRLAFFFRRNGMKPRVVIDHHDAECLQVCTTICPATFDPVCTTTNRTLSNACEVSVQWEDVQYQHQVPFLIFCSVCVGGYAIKRGALYVPVRNMAPEEACCVLEDRCASEDVHALTLMCTSERVCIGGCRGCACTLMCIKRCRGCACTLMCIRGCASVRGCASEDGLITPPLKPRA